MAFGHGLRGRFLTRTSRCVFAALILLAAGCGGGGGDGGNNGGGGGVGTATITGTVVRQTDPAGNKRGIAGAVISYPGVPDTVTAASGAFSLTVPTPASPQRLKISAPQYQDLGRYEPIGNSPFTAPLATQGVLVPALSAGETRDLGTFGLYHSVFDPPLPPTLPATDPI